MRVVPVTIAACVLPCPSPWQPGCCCLAFPYPPATGGAVPPPADGALRVVNMNTHYILLDATDDRPWSVAGWQRRRGAMADVLTILEADLIAFLEMESFRRGDDGLVNMARDDLLVAMPEFSLAASGDWRQFPSPQPIYYRTDRPRLVEQGWFYFSDRPKVIYSPTFNGSYPAFASWAEFRIAAPARGCASSTCIWTSAVPGTGWNRPAWSPRAWNLGWASGSMSSWPVT